MKEQLKEIISKSAQKLSKEAPDFSVEIPSDKKHGDYSTNIALVLAKKIGKNPIETANLIKEEIKIKGIFKKIEIAGPGFLNFFLADQFFIENLKKINKEYGKGDKLKNKKIIVDYTDPNILKEFHIGHLMSNTIGESLCRLFEFEGAKVKRLCYQSDIGMGVAKAVWGMKFLPKADSQKQFPEENDSLDKKIKFIGAAYAFGAQAYENNPEAKQAIVETNRKVFEKSDKDINDIYEKGKKWSLEHFSRIYKKLDTNFDYFVLESEVTDLGRKIVEKGLKDKVFEKGDGGAVIFKGEKYGLHTRVFINSEGLPTYEAKDLGLAEFKADKYKYDQSIVVTANEQSDYFKVMLCALGKINPKLAERTKHIGHGMMRLPEGKMSSRTGKVITGESLIEKLEELVKEKIKDRDLSEEAKAEVVESVAVGAVRYSVLKQSIGSDIVYDFDKSISFEGDSGPYLQYSYTRAKSVLQKAKTEKIKPSFKKNPQDVNELEKMMYYFPEIILEAQKNCEPHLLVLYLTELAGIFNSYYAKNKIVDKTDGFSPYKVALTEAFSTIMKNGMRLLGIKTLERM